MSGLYQSRDSNSAVVPARDFNHPSPPVAGTEEPAFLEDSYQRLAAVRKQLSGLWTKYMGNRMGGTPYDPESGSAIEQQVDYDRERRKLELEESALVAQINSFVKVASLAPADNDIDDIPSVAHGAIPESGGDVQGSKDRT